MTTPSNDVLEERFNNMKEQNNKDHRALFKKIDGIENKIDDFINKLDDKYVMRKEFKVAVGLLGVFATILGIISYFIG